MAIGGLRNGTGDRMLMMDGSFFFFLSTSSQMNSGGLIFKLCFSLFLLTVHLVSPRIWLKMDKTGVFIHILPAGRWQPVCGSCCYWYFFVVLSSSLLFSLLLLLLFLLLFLFLFLFSGYSCCSCSCLYDGRVLLYKHSGWTHGQLRYPRYPPSISHVLCCSQKISALMSKPRKWKSTCIWNRWSFQGGNDLNSTGIFL